MVELEEGESGCWRILVSSVLQYPFVVVVPGSQWLLNVVNIISSMSLDKSVTSNPQFPDLFNEKLCKCKYFITDKQI